VEKARDEIERLHKIHGSYPRVCEAVGLPQNVNATLWAVANDAYVSPAALRRIKRALFPESVKPQPRPCPNAEQVALFNELGCSTWSEVIDAGLERLQAQAKVREQFGQVMEHIKEKMDAQG